MRIERLTYHDHSANWHLHAVEFYPDLTLFVGRSPADKWQLLSAIDQLTCFALGDMPEELCGVRWELRLATDAGRYDWQGEISGPEFSLRDGLGKAAWQRLLPHDVLGSPTPLVRRETVSLDGRILIERRGRAVRLDGRAVAACSRSMSVLRLLHKEAAVAPLFAGFGRVAFGDESRDTLANLGRPLQEFCASYPDLDAIRASGLPTYYKLAVVHENVPDVFRAIVQSMREHLPSVADLAFDRVDRSRFADVPALRLLEKGSEHWQPASKLSGTLLRAVLNLAAGALWPNDSVILIDEFETNLGVHCLEPVLEAARDASRNIQFILTSDNAAVIQRIGRERRKEICWQGAVVCIDDAAEFVSGKADASGVSTVPGVTARWRRAREKTGITLDSRARRGHDAQG